ncbi:hypothetical protein ACP79Z_15450 [Vibrio cholerae]
MAAQKQKRLAKELTTLGLIEVIGNKNAYKVVHSVESIIETWEFTNSKLNTFKNPTQTTKRKESRNNASINGKKINAAKANGRILKNLT